MYIPPPHLTALPANDEIRTDGSSPEHSFLTDTTLWQDIHVVLARIEELGVLAVPNAGQEQYDSLARVEARFAAQRAGDESKQIPKFAACFYCQSDVERAMKSGWLSLGLWAQGQNFTTAVVTAGTIIKTQFEQAGFVIDWNGSKHMRPLLCLTRAVKR